MTLEKLRPHITHSNRAFRDVCLLWDYGPSFYSPATNIFSNQFFFFISYGEPINIFLYKFVVPHY